MIWIFILIFIISFFIAFRSMSDFDIPKEIKHFLTSKKIKGTIVFFKGKTKHYSSISSRSSG